MTITATIYEAKTNLSELIKKAQSGDTVLITSGREKRPVATIHPIALPPVQRLGAWATPGFELGEAFWEPMTDEECGLADDDDPLL